MQNLQEIFDRIQSSARERHELNTIYKDSLEQIKEYTDALDKIQVLRKQKKQIEISVRAQLSSEIAKLRALQKDIQTDRQLLSDAALNTLVKGEEVKVVDAAKTEYEPLFSVKFRRKN
jgi:hypothetical protein